MDTKGGSPCAQLSQLLISQQLDRDICNTCFMYGVGCPCSRCEGVCTQTLVQLRVGELGGSKGL